MKHYLIKIDVFLFFCLIFTLSRQLPLNKVPVLLPAFTVAFMFFALLYYSFNIGFSAKKLAVHLGITSFILFLAICSNNPPELVARFFFILFLINVPLIFNIANVRYLTWFFLSLRIQSVLLILAGVFIPILFTLDSYSVIRQMILSNSWGDIYTYNGVFYRIQVIGNALLPIFFFINYDIYRRTNTSVFWMLISLVAIIFAGNLAFYLSLLIFIALYEVFITRKFRVNIKFITLLLLIAAIIPFLIIYFIELVVMKSGGSGSSLGIRSEQLTLLISNLASSNYSVLFGTGLGNTLNVITDSRNYVGDIYYELQTIYILNQIGFIPFMLYLTLHFYLFLSIVKNYLSLIIYFVYLTYGFVNPYMFDTTHIVVLIVILSYELKLNERKLSVDRA